MLDAVKLAMRPPIKTNAYDGEIRDLIEAAKADLSAVGILGDESKPLIRQAIKTYCRLNFGDPEDPERLRKSYAEQKAQLMTNSGHTDWGDGNGPQ